MCVHVCGGEAELHNYYFCKFISVYPLIIMNIWVIFSNFFAFMDSDKKCMHMPLCPHLWVLLWIHRSKIGVPGSFTKSMFCFTLDMVELLSKLYQFCILPICVWEFCSLFLPILVIFRLHNLCKFNIYWTKSSDLYICTMAHT